MGLDIGVRPEEVFRNEDRSWLGTRMGTLDCRSITLDPALFDDVHVEDKGAVPSGTALALYASGKYGPYKGDEEIQTLTRTSTGGTITVSVDGEVTAAIPATAGGFTAAALLAALNALSNVDPGDVTITGAAGGPLVVTFGGQYAEEDAPALVVDNAAATGGTITVAQTNPGGGDGSSFAGLLFSTTPVDLVDAFPVGAALFWTGVVKISKLPVFSDPTKGGATDAGARALSAAHIRWEA